MNPIHIPYNHTQNPNTAKNITHHHSSTKSLKNFQHKKNLDRREKVMLCALDLDQHSQVTHTQMRVKNSTGRKSLKLGLGPRAS